MGSERLPSPSATTTDLDASLGQEVSADASRIVRYTCSLHRKLTELINETHENVKCEADFYAVVHCLLAKGGGTSSALLACPREDYS